MTFKYNGKLYRPKNPEKKLKQLGITLDDVEIINEDFKEETEEMSDIPKYYFINKKTGYSITSIYPFINDNDYEKCTKGCVDEAIKWR